MPELKIGDETFPCKDDINPYVLVRFTKAAQKAAKAEALAAKLGKSPAGQSLFDAMNAAFDFALAVVQPEEQDRLEQFFIDAEDIEWDQFAAAISKFLDDLRQEAERTGGDEVPPPERPISSSDGPSSSSGSGRVVSLSPVTVSEGQGSSTVGASAGS